MNVIIIYYDFYSKLLLGGAFKRFSLGKRWNYVRHYTKAVRLLEGNTHVYKKFNKIEHIYDFFFA